MNSENINSGLEQLRLRSPEQDPSLWTERISPLDVDKCMEYFFRTDSRYIEIYTKEKAEFKRLFLIKNVGKLNIERVMLYFEILSDPNPSGFEILKSEDRLL